MAVPQWVIDMENESITAMKVDAFGFSNGRHPEWRPDEPLPGCSECGHSRHDGPCLGTHITPPVAGLQPKAVCTPCRCSHGPGRQAGSQ